MRESCQPSPPLDDVRHAAESHTDEPLVCAAPVRELLRRHARFVPRRKDATSMGCSHTGMGTWLEREPPRRLLRVLDCREQLPRFAGKLPPFHQREIFVVIGDA
jgi:hypothetical protein